MGVPCAPRKATKDDSDAYLVDTRFTPDRTQEELAQQSRIEAVGPYWRILRSEPAAPLDAFAIVESEPTPFERYFVSGTEPHREIVPDPFLTWELRTNLGQVATPPTEPPRSFDQKRIAFNIAVQSGDSARATALEAELMSGLTPVHARFENGTEILLTTYRGGAQSELTVLLKAGEPLDDGVRLVVRSRVVAPPRFSTVPADPDEREVNAPPTISLHRAHSGFLYAEVIPIRKRPGTEVFNATFGRLPRGRRRGVGEELQSSPPEGPGGLTERAPWSSCAWSEPSRAPNLVFTAGHRHRRRGCRNGVLALRELFRRDDDVRRPRLGCPVGLSRDAVDRPPPLPRSPGGTPGCVADSRTGDTSKAPPVSSLRGPRRISCCRCPRGTHRGRRRHCVSALAGCGCLAGRVTTLVSLRALCAAVYVFNGRWALAGDGRTHVAPAIRVGAVAPVRLPAIG